MPERAVFLDRDDTLIDNDGYLGDPSKVRLLAGAATAVSALRALGYRLIVVSNQSGVARGLFDEAAVEAVNQEMCKQLKEQAAAHIDASYYCPYHPDAPLAEYRLDHDWRKPKPGMLLQAAADFGLDLSQSWMIGDQPRDIAAGAAAGTRTILLRDPTRRPGDADPPQLEVSPNFIVRTLADAARIIAREGRNPPATAAAAISSAGRTANPPTERLSDPVSNAATPREATAAAQPLPLTPPAPAVHDTSMADAAAAEQIAARVARQIAQAAPAAGAAPTAASEKLQKTLEDLAVQLRHQNRTNDMQPDFALSHMLALVVQIIAVVVFIAGVAFLISSGVTFNGWEGTMQNVLHLARAVGFLVAAGFLQMLALTLHLYGRQK